MNDDAAPPIATALSEDGEILATPDLPLSAIPEPLRAVAKPMTTTAIAKVETKREEEAAREDRAFVQTVRKVVTDKKHIRAGLFQLDKRQLKESRNAAIEALMWVLDLRDPNMAREIVVAARELLVEARERDAMHMEANTETTRTAAMTRGTLSEGQAARLLRAVEEE